MSNKIIHAIYDDEITLLKAVKEIRNQDIRIKEVYSPFPIHGLDKALGLKETRMAITAFIYGCIGISFGGLLIYYIMISGDYKSWPMNIGNKPNWTFYHNLPAFVPIMFELTVLFAAHLMSITYFFRNKLYPGSNDRSPDIRTTDDKFLMEIEATDSNSRVKEMLQKTGAIEINEK
ncbi:MAG: DUF3341 domain-containing protein [Bacteroidota bacterium]|nr:DUF3341 domain-containing protein [Bacteroidota bacterium]